MDNGTLSSATYDAFRAHPLLRGADEVIERHWLPNQVVGEHSHPFDADAVLLRNETAEALMSTAGFKQVHSRFILSIPAANTWLRRVDGLFSRLHFGAQYYVSATA